MCSLIRILLSAHRGMPDACGEYVKVLQKHRMIPSMSRPANPYDNASGESLLKTRKREEIYAHDYRDLDHRRTNIEAFIEQYDNRCRLHSATGRWTSSSKLSIPQKFPVGRR